MEKQKYSFMNYLALIMIGLLSGMPGLVSPIIQTAIQTYPDIPTSTIRMLTTLPNLVATFTGFLFAMLVGKKIKFRQAYIFGSICCVIGGLAPFFFHSTWTAVLVCRFILGLGVGSSRTNGATVMRSLPKEKQASFIGLGMVAANISHMIFQPVAGALADKQFHLSFLVYFMAVVVLVFTIFFLKEPEGEEIKTEAVAKAPKEKLNPWLIALLAISLLNITCLYPFNTGISSYVVDKGVGTALMAGTALSIYTFAGMAGNLFLKPVTKFLGKYSLAITDLCISIGLVVLVRTNGAIGIYIAGLLCGFGYITASSCLQLASGKIATAGMIVVYATFVSCVSGIGAFISSYYITLAHKIIGAASEVQSAYTMSIIVFAALALFGFVFANKINAEQK